MLIVWTGSNCVGKSQTTDTLCFPIQTVKKLLIDAKQKKYADSLVFVYRSDINILSGKVQALEVKDSVNREINSTYKNLINTMETKTTILGNQIEYLNKELKKQKRKTTFAAIGGIALTALVSFLLITK